MDKDLRARTICTTGHPRYGCQYDPTIRDHARWGTHLSMLTKYLSLVCDKILWPGGTLLEHGAGAFSSPVMQAYMDVLKVPLLTIEDTDRWSSGPVMSYKDFIASEKPLFVPVALIDGPTLQRMPLVDLIWSNTIYLVVHDVEPEHIDEYFFPRTWLENNVELDKSVKPWTVVLRGGFKNGYKQ